MNLPFIKQDDLDTLKQNLDIYLDNFKNDSNDWLQKALGHFPFLDTKFPMPKFHLDMSQPIEKAYLTDSANCQEVYSKLHFLTDSVASDERLWAGLCLGPFWEYTQYRWNIKKNCTVSQVKQHFFFGYGERRSLSRNAVSRLWWIGRLTIDESLDDPYELTKFVCENSDHIMHIIERNTSNNKIITKAFINAILTARKNGLKINTDIVGNLSKYLNLLGGIYILDCLPYETIYNKILTKAQELAT
jgi:hypothetical protein